MAPPAAMPATDFFDMTQALPFWQSSPLTHLNPINAVNRVKLLLESAEQLHLHLVRTTAVPKATLAPLVGN
jgi:hypothetical protein